MKKPLEIPVVKDEMLMTIMGNQYGSHRYLGYFQAPGSVPPSKEFSMLRRNPDWYDVVPELSFTKTLQFLDLRHYNYVKTGAIWRCVTTGACYFMNDENLIKMMSTSTIVGGEATGAWHIEKARYAFTLVWNGEE